jgi:hypothetical protein
MHHAFTITYQGRARVLTTKVGVCLPVTLDEAKNNSIDIRQYTAIWDTGATNSVITKKVVEDLNLKPINVVKTNHAGGTSMANVYLVNIALPNGVMAGQIKVTEAQLTENEDIAESEQNRVLIGMDIIGGGDFAVTNFENKTTMSFRIPSAKMIDFIPSARSHNIIEGGNRQQKRAMKAKQR